MLWPKRGFRRAGTYIVHRLRRLPDQPHRVARGIFSGVFISFTPFFGGHLGLGLALAWLMRGNLIAAAIGTFAGNPLTFPFIAPAAVGLGQWLTGVEAPLSALYLVVSFSEASEELWANIVAIFTRDPTEWYRLAKFYETIYRPYMVGGVILGLGVGLAFYALTIPLVRTYQRLRLHRLRQRHARRNEPRLPEADSTPTEHR
ncbi:DUF2062 domain-containing protein [Alitabrizicola rongguiensis]|uniref:DUF2062 domain-containing protein n=1 Tax=Alitabrizicola rongguiensis TaxID=2909234 RepID=UPI001F2CFF0E|nr:DUF2062 domain-containing protein [Tabrizicola rongguiensis]